MAAWISKGIKADAAKDKKFADFENDLAVANEQEAKNAIAIQKLRKANETQRRQLTAQFFSG